MFIHRQDPLGPPMFSYNWSFKAEAGFKAILTH